MAISLAFTIAKETASRCVLIDANLEKPAATQKLLGGVEAAGLADAVRARGEGALEPVAIQGSNLWMVPAGRDPQAGLLFHRDVIDRLLSDLVNRFDLILLDGAGLLSAGANAVAHASDHFLYILDSTITRREVAEKAIAASGLDRSKLAGVVLNKRIHYIPEFLYGRF